MDRWPRDPRATYFVVDEGPGLSGSSFAAVAGYLRAEGVPDERICFITGHSGGPGSKADQRVRDCWSRIRHVVADSDALITPERLADWAAPLLGPLDGPLVDISGGRWRAHIWADERYWPAVAPHEERQKYLARAGGETWLLKQAGLGEEGARKLARGRAFHAAGLIPELRGLVHGYLVQRWVKAEPLASSDRASLRSIAHYLGTRARLSAPAPDRGASIVELFEMACFNIDQALGSAAAERMRSWEPHLERLRETCRPIESDNRCAAHEWLRLPDGHILKADALDHHAGHDLIGCQDIAWDVAGVVVELDLNSTKTAFLVAQVEQAAQGTVSPALLSFLTRCYLAFQIGAAILALHQLGHWPEEADRIRLKIDVYSQKLRQALNEATP